MLFDLIVCLSISYVLNTDPNLLRTYSIVEWKPVNIVAKSEVPDDYGLRHVNSNNVAF